MEQQLYLGEDQKWKWVRAVENIYPCRKPTQNIRLTHRIIVTIWTDLIVWDRLGCWQKKGVRIESELLWTPLAPLPGAGASYLRDNLWDWKIKEGHDQHVLLLTAYGSHQVALSHANHQAGGEGADVRCWEVIMKISGRITSKLLIPPIGKPLFEKHLL